MWSGSERECGRVRLSEDGQKTSDNGASQTQVGSDLTTNGGIGGGRGRRGLRLRGADSNGAGDGRGELSDSRLARRRDSCGEWRSAVAWHGVAWRGHDARGDHGCADGNDWRA